MVGPFYTTGKLLSTGKYLRGFKKKRSYSETEFEGGSRLYLGERKEVFLYTKQMRK